MTNNENQLRLHRTEWKIGPYFVGFESIIDPNKGRIITIEGKIRNDVTRFRKVSKVNYPITVYELQDWRDGEKDIMDCLFLACRQSLDELPFVGEQYDFYRYLAKAFNDDIAGWKERLTPLLSSILAHSPQIVH